MLGSLELGLKSTQGPCNQYVIFIILGPVARSPFSLNGK